MTRLWILTLAAALPLSPGFAQIGAPIGGAPAGHERRERGQRGQRRPIDDRQQGQRRLGKGRPRRQARHGSGNGRRERSRLERDQWPEQHRRDRRDRLGPLGNAGHDHRFLAKPGVWRLVRSRQRGGRNTAEFSHDCCELPTK